MIADRHLPTVAPAIDDSSRRPVRLSVVIPVYGCAGSLRELHRRLVAVLERAVEDYEIVFVDDRARDGAWPILSDLADADSRVVALRLARNSGQHIAITAGLAETRFEYVAVMDCDLEDPPELIPQFLDAALAGAEIVFARRRKTTQAWWRTLINRTYFSFLNYISGVQMDGDFGTFSVISQRVVNGILRFRERDRHYLFILRWLGFDAVVVDYDRGTRSSGQSSYSWRHLVNHAVAGIYFHSNTILLWIVYAGFALSFLGVVLAIGLLVHGGLSATIPAGWTSLMVGQLLSTGIILISVGTVGLYVARIFDEVKDRPLFVVDRRLDRRVPRADSE